MKHTTIYLITCDNNERYPDSYEEYNVCYFTNREDAEKWLRENNDRREAYEQYHKRRNQLIAEIVVPDEPNPEKPKPTSLKMTHTEQMAYVALKRAYEMQCRAIYARQYDYRQQKIAEIDAMLGEQPLYSFNARIEEIELGCLNNTSSRTQ
jgi:hypothetical protein